MGRNEKRFWDERTRESRAVVDGDPRKSLFDAFVPHGIARWEPLLDHWTWKRYEDAMSRCRELATLDHPAMSEWLLVRAESLASSTIEDIHASARRVARVEARRDLFGETPPGTESEVLRNIWVTQHATELASSDTDLTVDLLCQMHMTLMGDAPISGQVRNRQVWVGSGAFGGPIEARHVAPPVEHVSALLEDLMDFVNHSDGHPLLRAAVAHAQFETIHPFADGNGRTGRALIQYMLMREGVISGSTLPVSAALTLERHRYFDTLNSYRVVCDPDDGARSKAAMPWIRMFAEAATYAAVLHDRLNKHIEALTRRWEMQARANRIRPSNAAFKLLGKLPANPVVTTSKVQELLGVNKRTAQNAVARLVDAEILVQRSAGRANRVYESSDLLDAYREASRGQLAVLTAKPEMPDTAVLPLAESVSGLLCGAANKRGGSCAHPRPRPGGTCPAGHQQQPQS
ncbi:MAG: Fic family protein [Acidimicrobiia bacterium]|nr:Fic family protein [Acidimicrobiia bacterium]MCY4458266.1 Fic family protein [Acidimicrobiaceae bacterium]